MIYSFKNQYPKPLPDKIRLSNGSLRTDRSSFTNAEIADAGYVLIAEPEYDLGTEKLEWNGTTLTVVSLTEKELQAFTDEAWKEVRSVRDSILQNFEWRISRYLSETRQGINPTTDNIAELDAYAQALRDITKQADPSTITWPIEPV
tara:strand:+ start:498 stop:938 length:441 start_codon:yes stop_codon:yes gene_type:complete